MIIAISDDLHEIFQVLWSPEDPEDAVPFLVRSSDNKALRSSKADGKILFYKIADYFCSSLEPMQYLHDIIRKTEYCWILCFFTNPVWIQPAGEIALSTRDQNTLTVLAVIGEKNRILMRTYLVS